MLLTLEQQLSGLSAILRGQALLVPQMPHRNYSDMARLNPFVGGIPVGDDALALAEKKKRLEREAITNATLVFTNFSEQKALLVPPEKSEQQPIKLAPDSTFPLWDKKSGKVLRIDHRDVYFELESKIYGIHIGQNLAEALEHPLSLVEGEKRGLMGKRLP
jgi:hypothetical protein